MLTDNDIIKALKECLTEPCSEQAYINAVRNALDLINRQRAEINKLTYQVNRLKKYDEERDIALHSRLIATAKAEAFKEFAKRFENELTKIEEIYFDEEHENFISANKVIALLVNLVKEMVGDSDV